MSHYGNSPYWRSYDHHNITESQKYEYNFYSLENNSEKWDPSRTYYASSKVTYKGKVYEAKWLTKGDMPDKKIANPWETPWKLVKKKNITQDKHKDLTSPPKWNNSKTYVGGDKVTYNDNIYEAKWWTKDDIPNEKVSNHWETPWKLVK